MNYICKDCKHNNHGWCNKRKFQHRKEVTECANYYSTSYTKINELTKEEADLLVYVLKQSEFVSNDTTDTNMLISKLSLYLTTEEDN